MRGRKTTRKTTRKSTRAAARTKKRGPARGHDARRLARSNPAGAAAGTKWTLARWTSNLWSLLFGAQYAGEEFAIERGIAACLAVALGSYNPPGTNSTDSTDSLSSAALCDLRMTVQLAGFVAHQPSPGGHGPLATANLVESLREVSGSLSRELESDRWRAWDLYDLMQYVTKATDNDASANCLSRAAVLYGSEDATALGEYVGAKAMENAIANMEVPTYRKVILRDIAVEVLRAMLRGDRQWLDEEEAVRMLGTTPDGRNAAAAAEQILAGVEQASGASFWRILVSEASAAAEEGNHWQGAFDFGHRIAREAFARSGDPAFAAQSDVWHDKRSPEAEAMLKVPGATPPKRYQRPKTGKQRATEKVRKAADLVATVFSTGSGTDHNSYDVAAAVVVAMGLGRDDLHAVLERAEYDLGEPMLEYEDEAQATYGRLKASDDPMAEAAEVLGEFMPKTTTSRKRPRPNPPRGTRRTRRTHSRAGGRRSVAQNGRSSPRGRSGR